jgi:hypothetical protein
MIAPPPNPHADEARQSIIEAQREYLFPVCLAPVPPPDVLALAALWGGAVSFGPALMWDVAQQASVPTAAWTVTWCRSHD